MAIPALIIYVVIVVLLFLWNPPTTDESYLTFSVTVISLGLFFGFIYLILSYAGEGSKLHGLKPLTDRLPTIKRAEGHVHFKTKMMWTLLILIFYFIMTNVMIYGLDQEKTLDLFEAFRAVMAGASGSLMHLGIGPIVTA
ncbi:MAG: preprotein translocase subunit SecY, partial [Thermoplasmata archaeon]|nr:preprotein translocase subunit SecY [Thermoplasmata archaeon]